GELVVEETPLEVLLGVTVAVQGGILLYGTLLHQVGM
ncbi:hypothetical protein LCGC14_2182440, partial [marine sediment metagenome]